MKLTANQTKIIAALTESTTPLTSGEVAKLIGTTAPTALKNCEALLKLSLIERGPSKGNAYTFQCGEVEVPADEPKIIEGKVECQVCEGHYCEDRDGCLWNHGYQRPGWGWLVGGCYGVGHKPFPATNRLEDYLVAVQNRQATVATQLSKRDTWPTLVVEERIGRGYSAKKELVTLTRPTAEARAEEERAYRTHSTLETRAWKAQKGEAKPLTAEESAQDKADHDIWIALYRVREKWESAHKTQVWRLESEQKELAHEVGRVVARIAKGKALCAEAVTAH